MNLYVVRHGETTENKTQMMQGNMDTELNEVGINQAKLVKEQVLKEKIDLIISSPKKRTLKTAEIISDNNIPIITDERLLSRDHGEFEGMSRNDVNIEEYWNIKKNIQYKKAESVKHIYDRIESLLNDIKTNYKDKNILLVTHSGICRILYYYFNGIPEDGNLIGYESTNCSFEKYELEEEK